jgi:hypothetical protein
MSAQLNAPAALLTGKERPYPLVRRLGEPQSRSGRGGEEKKNPYSWGESKTSHPARSQVTILTELQRIPALLVKKQSWHIITPFACGAEENFNWGPKNNFKLLFSEYGTAVTQYSD